MGIAVKLRGRLREVVEKGEEGVVGGWICCGWEGGGEMMG